MYPIPLSKSQRKLCLEVIPMGLGLGLLVLLMRTMGWFQAIELSILDQLLYFRYPESTSQHIVLVGITEDDINIYGGFPLSDKVLTQALDVIEKGNPSVIGLDLFRDSNSNESGRMLLGQMLKKSPKIIGATVALNAKDTLNIPAPPELKPTQVGFVDVIVDPDHKLRRMILASRTWSGKLKYSLSLRLARAHLKHKGIPFQHGDRASAPIKLGSKSFHAITSDIGGYQKIDTNGNQLLLNPLKASPPFLIVSMQKLLSSDFDLNQIRDRVVIIGMTATSVKDSFYNDAIPHTILTETFDNSAAFRGRVYGVEFHAHATHQLVSSVLAGRPTIWTFPSWFEGIIIFGGLIGMLWGLWLRSPWKSLLGLCCITLCLTGISIFCIEMLGLWLPLPPLILTLNTTGLMTTFADRELRRLLDERHSTITKTFDAVHNGPLQTLAILKRQVAQERWSTLEITNKLQILNQELRCLYENLESAALEEEERVILQSKISLNLNLPLEQLMHQVYNETLQRSFPGFSTLSVCLAPNLSGLEGLNFQKEQKRKLCLFLEEALNNVGKHGNNSVVLDVNCLCQGNYLVLKIINKVTHSPQILGVEHKRIGQGTIQALETAKFLKGNFSRQAKGNQFICQLTWPIKKSPLNFIDVKLSKLKNIKLLKHAKKAE